MSASHPFDPSELLVAGYVLGDLSPEEFAELEQLLATQPQIAREIANTQRALELAYNAPEVVAPTPLRNQILAGARAIAASAATASRTSASRTSASIPTSETAVPSFAWGKAFAVAATALIALLGIANYRLQTRLAQVQLPPSSPLETPIAKIQRYSLKSTAADPASAQLLVNPATLEAQLIGQNLPPLPSDQVYVLWTVVDKNAPVTKDAKGAILTQSFRVSAEGQISQTLVVPPVYRDRQWVIAFAVTAESAAAPQAHQGTVKIIAKT